MTTPSLAGAGWTKEESLDGCPEGLWLTHRAGEMPPFRHKDISDDGWGNEEVILIDVKPE